MGHNSIKSRITIGICVLLTLLCSTVLTLLALRGYHSASALLIVSLFAVIFICQIIFAVISLKQRRQLAKFQRLSRKLVHSKSARRRDENLAVKILNHINSVSGPTPNHASIWQKPLHGFSGDLAIACESRCGKKYTLLADLTGHGIAAAMGAAPVASIFQATSKRGLTVAEIITELNNRLAQLLPSGFFCCAAVIMNDEGVTSVCNAGLPDILVANNDGNIVDRIHSKQLPLGIQTIDSSEVELFTRDYDAPHQLYAVTDGLIESAGANDEIFDLDVLISLITCKNNNTGRIESITSSFETFAKDSEQSDDISIVEVKICLTE